MNIHTHSLSSAIIQENTIAQYKERANSLNNESPRIIYYIIFQFYKAYKYTWETPSFILSQNYNFITPACDNQDPLPKSGRRALTRSVNQTSQPNLHMTGGRPHPSHPLFISTQWAGDLKQVPFLPPPHLSSHDGRALTQATQEPVPTKRLVPSPVHRHLRLHSKTCAT